MELWKDAQALFSSCHFEELAILSLSKTEPVLVSTGCHKMITDGRFKRVLKLQNI